MMNPKSSHFLKVAMGYLTSLAIPNFDFLPDRHIRNLKHVSVVAILSQNFHYEGKHQQSCLCSYVTQRATFG